MAREKPDRTRGGGVEFGPLKGALQEHQYPVTTAELVEIYGGFELEGPDGSVTVEDALVRIDAGSFRTPQDVRDALVTGTGGRSPGDDATDGNTGEDAGNQSDDDAVAGGDWSPKSL